MKKYVSTFLVLAMLAVAWTSPVLAGFMDVDGNAKYIWAKPSIDEMSRKGIVTGFPDGSFRPAQNVTKAQFTVMVYRLFPQLRNPEPSSIPGVPDNHWASREFAELYSTIDPIYAADEQNFLDESYTYKPEKGMTRWEVLMTLDALFGRMPGPSIGQLDSSDGLAGIAAVKDVRTTTFVSFEAYEDGQKSLSLMKPLLAVIEESDWTDFAGDLDYVKADALYRFMDLGIMTADGSGYFYPDRVVSRAEIATILNRMLAVVGEDYAYEEPEESLSGSYLYPGSGTGFGSNLFYLEPYEDIVLAATPEWEDGAGTVLTKVAIQVESEQVMDVYVTVNGVTTKYMYEQLIAPGNRVIVDVTGVKSIHVRGAARYPELMGEDGNNEVMIYVRDPDMDMSWW
ncbi:S-layer homology domain-containing protein [Paenibacillus agaridevorans]|uniref:S-layer homology domain-containing protein n=1 Tax=Paenibacillus agaridevorans TaxID=171404 RepID=UPI001BE4317F|nr:S-layer homology domain-containing protein [Paenibacillus agaridevorans]